MHPTLTPLADDVDFRALAEKYPVSGGDIRNAVLKAALAAAAEPGPDSAKALHQRHFEDGIREVVTGKRAMRQSLFDDLPEQTPPADRMVGAVQEMTRGLSRRATIATILAAAGIALSLAALLTAWFR